MKNIFLFAAAAAVSVSCSSAKTGMQTFHAEVPYKEAKNYFVKNNQEEASANSKFESQQEFDKVFGMATTMGENGKPTAIDFSKEFAVAQIENPSSQKVELKPVSVKKNAEMLEIKYRKIVGGIQTYTSQPALILIIDNKYKGDINFVEVQ